MLRRIAIYAIALMLLLAGCARGANPPAKPAPVAATSTVAPVEPETYDAAAAGAQVAFDRYTARDYVGAWQMYTAESRALISQADYVRLNTACPDARDAHVEVAAGRLLQADIALILADAGGTVVPYTMDYRDGHWLIEATVQERELYAEGVDKAIADRKAHGDCDPVATVA